MAAAQDHGKDTDHMIFDTHAHYDDEQFDTDREELLERMAAGGVGTIVNASAAVESWDKVLELTEKYPFIYGMIGVHPLVYPLRPRVFPFERRERFEHQLPL